MTKLYTNKQDIFDKAARHLLTQMEICQGRERCLYRGPNGLKCAVGALIPDELYNKGMEREGIYDFVSHRLNPTFSHIFYNRHADLLRRLQLIHDDSLPCEWFNGLKGVATDFKLNKKVLKEFKQAVE